MKHEYNIELFAENHNNSDLWNWSLLEGDYVIEESISAKTYQRACEEAYSRYCFYTLDRDSIVLRSAMK